MDAIQEGFDVFVHDGEKAFGAVRRVSRHEIVVYVETPATSWCPSAQCRMFLRKRSF